MIREIEFTDIYGKSHKLHAIKHEEFSKYEILLPEKYTMVYPEASDEGARSLSCDINIELLLTRRMKKCDMIVVVNHDPAKLPWGMDVRYINVEDDINRLKNVAANAPIACIYLDKNKKLEQVIYHYQCVDDTHNFTECFWLFDDNGYLDKEYLLRENY